MSFGYRRRLVGSSFRPAAFAIGLATAGNSKADADKPLLDVYYPVVNRDQNAKSAAIMASVVGYEGGSASFRLTADQLNQLFELYQPYYEEAHKHVNAAAVKTVHGAMQHELAKPRLPKVAVVTFIADLDAAPVDEADAYLRLHLLSHRKVQPHGQSMDGMFGLLQNVAWTNGNIPGGGSRLLPCHGCHGR